MVEKANTSAIKNVAVDVCIETEKRKVNMLMTLIKLSS